MVRIARRRSSVDLSDTQQLANFARSRGLTKAADEAENKKLSFLQRLGRGLSAFEIGNAVYDSRYEDASFLGTLASDIGKGLGSAITGRDLREGDVKQTFKDIMVKEGMKDRPGKLDVVDVTGLAADILTDPTTFLGGLIGKGVAKGAGAGLKVAKKLPVIGKRIAQAEDVTKTLFKPFHQVTKELGERGDKYVQSFTKFVKGTRTQVDDFTLEMTKAAKKVRKDVGKEGAKKIGLAIETGTRTGDNLLDESLGYLLDTQKALTKQELERGIIKKELPNYMHHMLTEQSADFLASGGNVSAFVSKFKKSLGAAKERTIEGTVGQINKEFAAKHGFNLFEEDAFKAFAKRGLDSIQRVNTYDFFQRVGKQFGKEAKEDFIDEAGVKWVKSGVADLGDIRVPKPIADHLSEYNKVLTSDQSTGQFLKMFDSVQNFWKKTVTGYFPAFHTRNAIGGTFNNWIAGLKNPAMYKISRDILKGGDGVLKTKAGDLTYEAIRKLMKDNGVVGQTGFLDVVKKIGEDVSPNVLTKAKNLPQKVMGVVEDNIRAPLFVDGLKKYYTKDLIKNVGVDEAIDVASSKAAKRVIKYHFDYMPEGFTAFERNVMKRVIPFYTWTRHNVPLQLEQILMQPGKYAGVMKTQRAFGVKPSSEEETLMPDWLKDRFTIKGEGGYWSGLGLPMEEATEKISNPLRGLGLSLSPLIKTPFELMTGVNIFKNRKISEDTYGKVYRNAPQPIKNFLQLKETKGKDGKKFYTVNPKRRYWLELIVARGLSTAMKASNFVESPSELKSLITTINKYEYGIEDLRRWSDKETRKELEDALIKAGEIGKFEKSFIIKNK
jgi:hypothetical protein